MVKLPFRMATVSILKSNWMSAVEVCILTCFYIFIIDQEHEQVPQPKVQN
uniref:Uncharacterized protein n=1 Tax=Anguilla anguilla TaxID=7936 RepID=A0A0E9Q9M1_ANGAN